tara:strand:- start:2391 stop:3218 length:828 start_codon:yes stop_codon:yes gene_type:complete
MGRKVTLQPYAKLMPSRVSTLNDLIPFGFLNEESYSKNFKNNNEFIELNTVQDSELEEFKNNPWTYVIGKYNFRNTWNFDSSKPRIGFFGCSFTFGEGIKNEHTFVDIVSKNLNLNPFNFGSAGSGVERVARLFSAATSVIDFDSVVITLPGWHRQLHIDHLGNMINLIPHYPHCGFEKMSDVLTSLDEDYYIVRAATAVNWMYDIARYKNIKLIFSSWDHPQNEFCQLAFTDNTIDPFPNIDDKCARDKMHPGIKSQAAHAEQIIKAFNDRAWV